MNLYKSATYINDIDYVIANTPSLKQLSGSSVFVTGATGLICSAIVDLLLRYNEIEDAGINIYVAGRNKEKTQQRFCRFYDKKEFIYCNYDATKQNNLNFHADYIIHGANNAFPSLYTKYPVETMLDNFSALKELLDYAKRENSKRVAFISSSEIYGKNISPNPLKEDEYGFVDILNIRSCYSSSKRAAETLCFCYYQEYNVETVIIRPGHIFGPTASRSDTRVSSEFAYAVAEGKDIALKSDGSQIRSYCYMLDAATAIIVSLLYGQPGEAYNISNKDSIMSIREMAELMTKYGETSLILSKPTDDEKKLFNPMNNASLDYKKICGLGWHGLFDKKTGIEHTIRSLREAI